MDRGRVLRGVLDSFSVSVSESITSFCDCFVDVDDLALLDADRAAGLLAVSFFVTVGCLDDWLVVCDLV